MPRLRRPSIPVEVKCRVVLRQLGEMFIDDVIEANRAHPRDAYMKNISPLAKAIGRSLGKLLADRLPKLAELLGCPLEDLRLDHHPALENRQQFKNARGEIVRYVPDANDPDSLIYRTHHAHHIKTNVRGERGQFADNVIAKRERHRKKKIDRRPCARCFARYRKPPSRLCGRCQRVAKKYREKIKRQIEKRRRR